MFMIRSLGVAVAVVLLLTGCGGKPHSDSHSHDPRHLAVDILDVQTEPVSIIKQMSGQEGVVRLTITPQGFDPARLTYRMGEKVKIHVVNEADRSHNLIIPRFGIAASVMSPSAQTYIEFTASAQGTWPFFSDASRDPGDPVPGFVGTLKVE